MIYFYLAYCRYTKKEKNYNVVVVPSSSIVVPTYNRNTSAKVGHVVVHMQYKQYCGNNKLVELENVLQVVVGTYQKVRSILVHIHIKDFVFC